MHFNKYDSSLKASKMLKIQIEVSQSHKLKLTFWDFPAEIPMITKQERGAWAGLRKDIPFFKCTICLCEDWNSVNKDRGAVVRLQVQVRRETHPRGVTHSESCEQGWGYTESPGPGQDSFVVKHCGNHCESFMPAPKQAELGDNRFCGGLKLWNWDNGKFREKLPDKGWFETKGLNSSLLLSCRAFFFFFLSSPFSCPKEGTGSKAPVGESDSL